MNNEKLIPGQVSGNQMVVSLSPCLCGSYDLTGLYVCSEYAVKCLSCERVGDFYSGSFSTAKDWDRSYELKRLAVNKAKSILNSECLVFDTETTGLGDDAEIIEITFINLSGEVVLNTLIKPMKPIPDDVIAIHGITNEMVADAPTWDQVNDEVEYLFRTHRVTAYNLSFDKRLLMQTASLYGLDGFYVNFSPDSDCVMLNYANFYGEPGKSGCRKWQKLVNAAAQQNITITGTSHRALVDCNTTLDLLKVIANWKGGQS